VTNIQLDMPSRIEPVSSYVIRRPGIPRWWDPISRPHVAVIMKDPANGTAIRYFLSRRGEKNGRGRMALEVGDIDRLPEGTLLEVRYSATKTNLYQLEMVGSVACWKWINRSQGLQSFETDSFEWNYHVDSSLDPNSYLYT